MKKLSLDKVLGVSKRKQNKQMKEEILKQIIIEAEKAEARGDIEEAELLLNHWADLKFARIRGFNNGLMVSSAILVFATAWQIKAAMNEEG